MVSLGDADTTRCSDRGWVGESGIDGKGALGKEYRNCRCLFRTGTAACLPMYGNYRAVGTTGFLAPPDQLSGNFHPMLTLLTSTDFIQKWPSTLYHMP